MQSNASISSLRRPASPDASPAPGNDGAWTTAVPPPRPRVVFTIPALRNPAIASRSVARETRMVVARSRSGAARFTPRESAGRDESQLLRGDQMSMV